MMERFTFVCSNDQAHRDDVEVPKLVERTRLGCGCEEFVCPDCGRVYVMRDHGCMKNDITARKHRAHHEQHRRDIHD